MASGPPRVDPSEPPATPTIVTPDEGDANPDSGSNDDGHDSFGATDWDRNSLAPSPSPSPSLSPSFLHPQSHLLRPPTPTLTFTMASDDAPTDANAGAGAAPSPFNFQTQVISTSPVKSNIGQRRGHRYKHSSISTQHQIFQEPPPRPPPVLPASLPIPTFKEAWASMQKEQMARLWWCTCHAAVAVYVFFSAEGSLAMTALSHLVFFDVGSAAVCVAVDVLGNFEVWRRSSIRHPFGLQRAEVLAGFAMSVFLVFGGFDLLSHNLKHVLESVGEHTPHHPHNHRLVKAGTVDMASLAAIVSTLISAYGLQNLGRIRRVMRVPLPYLSNLLPGSGILANPFHFLTLCFSFLMLMLPLLSFTYYVWIDRLICASIAVSMFVLGTRLAIAQGLMLLMSYSGRNGTGAGDRKKTDSVDVGDTDVSAVVREIEAEPNVARVEEAQFWQVHYGLAMANLKLCLSRSCDDSTISQLRTRVTRVVQNRLGEGYGRGGSLRWEVTIQISTAGN